MLTENNKLDFELARRICDELLKGYPNAITEIFQLFHPLFLVLAQKQLYSSDPQIAEGMLDNFWVELTNGKAICNYEGRASLKNYLICILKWRITDCIRKQSKQQSMISMEEVSDLVKKESEQNSPEEKLEAEQRKKIIREAILLFETISPRETERIWLWSQGMSYKEMAIKEMAGQQISPSKLISKESAIRKQFTRRQTGTLAKFRIFLERFLKEKGLEIKDVLGN